MLISAQQSIRNCCIRNSYKTLIDVSGSYAVVFHLNYGNSYWSFWNIIWRFPGVNRASFQLLTQNYQSTFVFPLYFTNILRLYSEFSRFFKGFYCDCFLFFQSSSPSGSSRDCSSCSEEVLGEIAAEFNDITFFIAACYKSQVDLSYLCLQSQNVAFQHAPVVPQSAHVSMESTFSGAELQSTLYRTESGVRQVDGKTGEPMFAFAIKVSGDTSKNSEVRMQIEQTIT